MFYCIFLNILVNIMYINAGFTGNLDDILPPYIVSANNMIYKAIEYTPLGFQKGSVVASPNWDAYSNTEWIRDASTVMNIINGYYVEKGSIHENLLKDYALHTNILQQNTVTHSTCNNPNTDCALGEPKYYANTNVFTGPWGRPQNDGPALQAIQLIIFANKYMLLNDEKCSQGSIFKSSTGYVNTNLYQSTTPVPNIAINPIKRALEYVATYWQNYCFDPWEEVSGNNFYDLVVMRRAMVLGASFASNCGDSVGNKKYLVVAKTITDYISNNMWNSESKLIYPTINKQNGVYKPSNLDTQVILGSFHSLADESDDHYMGVFWDEMMSTIVQLEIAMNTAILYPINGINWNGVYLGTVIGRYPEDTYDGIESGSIGNPWFLTTNAVGEYYYRLYIQISKQGSFKVTNTNHAFYVYLTGDQDSLAVGNTYSTGLKAYDHTLMYILQKADAQLLRTMYQISNTYNTVEEFSFKTGISQGATDLTWSYASIITANNARSTIGVTKVLTNTLPPLGIYQTVIVNNVPTASNNSVFLCGDTINNWCTIPSLAVPLYWLRNNPAIPRYGLWRTIVTFPASTTNNYKVVICTTDKLGICINIHTSICSNQILYTNTLSGVVPVSITWC